MSLYSFVITPGELEKSFAAWGLLVETEKRIALSLAQETRTELRK